MDDVEVSLDGTDRALDARTNAIDSGNPLILYLVIAKRRTEEEVNERRVAWFHVSDWMEYEFKQH